MSNDVPTGGPGASPAAIVTDMPPRQGFLPPRYNVARLGAQSPADVSDVPAVPLLTDRWGEELPARPVRIALAWDDEHLHLLASWSAQTGLIDPDVAPDDPRFWNQDNLELRLLADPDRPTEQIQFIFAADGRFFDSLGLWRTPEVVAVSAEAGQTDADRRLAARIPFSRLGIRPRAGLVLWGIIAQTCWIDGGPDIITTSATVLGCPQAERYGQFVLTGDAAGGPAVRLGEVRFAGPDLRVGANAARVTLINPATAPVGGALRVTRESGAGAAGQTSRRVLTLAPGATEIDLTVELDRPTYCRYRFDFEQVGGTFALGSVCLRAAADEVDPGAHDRAHPYLLFDAAELEALRRKASRPGFEQIAESLKPSEADFREPDLPAAGERADLRDATADGGWFRVADYLRKWVHSGDSRLIALATRCVRAANEAMVLGEHIDLHEGGVASSLAIAYDAFFPHLPESDRLAWVELLRRFLELHLATARKYHWNCTAIPNANPVCNGGGGLVALALLAESPALAAESLRWARKFLWQWVDYCNGPDGGNTEGAQYWQYGTDNFLRFVVAMERVLGTDDGMLSGPGIRRHMNMVRVGLCPDGCMHGVNDTVPMPVGSEIAWWHAGRHGDAMGLWYGDHAQRTYRRLRDAGREAPYRADGLMALLYRPDVPECHDQPPLPLAMALPDIQYGVMRSGPNYDCRLAAGLKGSRPPYTHHNQPDTGSYFVHLRGERLLIDPGYYKEQPSDHSLPIIDGAAPARPDAFVGELVACCAAGDLRYLACDATAAYGGAAARVVRHLVMVGQEHIVLLDDIAGSCAGATVLAQYQAGGETEDLGDGRAVLIRGRQARLRLELLTRPELHLECRPERDLKDTHWGYKFAECRLFPVVGEYAADEADPLVTVFADATDAELPPSRLRRGDSEIAVVLPTGREVVFACHEGRWRLDVARSA